MKEKVVGIGAGGHAKVLVSILQNSKSKRYEISGFTDQTPEKRNTKFCGYSILGNDNKLRELYKKGIKNAFIGVGSVNAQENKKRATLYEMATDIGFKLINIIHQKAIISPSTMLTEGVSIMAGSLINPGTNIGKNVIVNTGSIIDHDCEIGDHVHIAPGAKLAGGVTVGENSYVGLGVSIIQEVTIGKNVTIGAGAVVLDDLPDNVTAVGVPAKPIKGD